MKEITLQDLLNMADAAAHDGIVDLWNQKTIHYLAVFTSENEDFELIGAGPTLPYPTLETIPAEAIPGKKPEFFVKCPGALAVRLQPKLAPVHMGVHAAPLRPGTRPPQPTATPTLKGRTSVPFMRPQLKLPPKSSDIAAQNTGPTPGSAEVATKVEPPIPQFEPSATSATPISTKPEIPTELLERERAIKQREQELTLLAASLKAREASLREREAAITAMEERLLNPPRSNS